ncbi:hypothetical protein H5410_015450 [Solanum commersonii]|uniref:Uncharacterized protein n=1 Tax=Solanum commersonii TaxID=4109 RepID=A0A9J5ZUF0_SOLCO|nr:hypothetical protein H5410_015450 [Solanum commersonii]
MDALTQQIQGEVSCSVSWCMLFTYNKVPIDKTRDGVNTKLEVKSKPWSLKDSGHPKRGSVKYLGSIIQGNWEIDETVTHHIGVGWMKWSFTYEALCEKVTAKHKASSTQGWLDKLYCMGLSVSESELSRAKDISGRDEDVAMDVGAASVNDKIREARLRWLGQAMDGFRRSRCRSNNYWGKMIRQNMS